MLEPIGRRLERLWRAGVLRATWSLVTGLGNGAGLVLRLFGSLILQSRAGGLWNASLQSVPKSGRKKSPPGAEFRRFLGGGNEQETEAAEERGGRSEQKEAKRAKRVGQRGPSLASATESVIWPFRSARQRPFSRCCPAKGLAGLLSERSRTIPLSERQTANLHRPGGCGSPEANHG
jgi:hypothetical protein